MCASLCSFQNIILLICFVSYKDVGAINPFKLPQAIKPVHYVLDLEPNIYNKTPDEFILYGKVEIDVNVISRTNLVRLHSYNLTIEKISVLQANEDLFRSMTYDSNKQWFNIELKQHLKIGKAKILIPDFQRPILHTLDGIYYYSRTNENETWYGVTTQLESTYARHMFPCFDEPDMKATFEVSIRRKEPYFSLSNMPLVRKVPLKKGWMVDYFQKSRIMSTYLVAVIVTKYKSISEMHRNVNFTIYYPEGKEDKVQLAMEVSRKVFSHLEDYFDVKYPLPKLDQIGFARRDFKFGGMENYGMITYGDMYLYQTPGSKLYDRYVAAVVLHEITHQWFGNLVTMKWWDDLWLNEGMTEFFSFLRSKWIIEYETENSGYQNVLLAMKTEIQNPKPPVYVPWARSPQQIESLINSVTYSKGGMLLKMAEIIMGEATFKKAMRTYIKNNMYGTVTHNHLWKAFTEADESKDGLNMAKILSPWLMQPGFPVVNATINYATSTIDFDQNVFFMTGPMYDLTMPKPSKYKYVWPIPFQFKTGNSGLSKVIMQYGKNGSITLSEKLYATDWLVINPEINFYYIVNYDKAHWKRIARQLSLDHLAFDKLTRAKLVFDINLLHAATRSKRGNYVDIDLMIEVLSYIKHEKAELPLNFMRYVLLDPGYDIKLKPIRDIFVKRNLIAKDF